MARHKLTKEQQIKGIRKALKNPKTPKQFLPSLRKRLAKLAVLAFLFSLPSIGRAQFVGYTSPQTVQQTLATSTACTGVNQTFNVQNLGQTQHQATVVPSLGTTNLDMLIAGIDRAGNVFVLSDIIWSGGTPQFSPAVNASGYYPIIEIIVKCSGGTFTLSYSGASATQTTNTGVYLSGAIDKALFQGQGAGTTVVGPLWIPPYGTSNGHFVFQFSGAGPANSSLNVVCFTGAITGSYASYTYNLVTTNGLAQIFPVPDSVCQQVAVTYTAGGASASTFNLDYIFDPPGTISAVSTAATLSSALNEGLLLHEKGARWSVLNAPAAGTQATASKAAGTAGVRHVADCVSYSSGAIAAPVATVLQVNLRDGASGAGTIIWTQTIDVSTTLGSDGAQDFCGLNLIGTAATAMTLEYSAGLANLNQSVTLTGYDVQ